MVNIHATESLITSNYEDHISFLCLWKGRISNSTVSLTCSWHTWLILTQKGVCHLFCWIINTFLMYLAVCFISHSGVNYASLQHSNWWGHMTASCFPEFLSPCIVWKHIDLSLYPSHEATSVMYAVSRHLHGYTVFLGIYMTILFNIFLLWLCSKLLVTQNSIT